MYTKKLNMNKKILCKAFNILLSPEIACEFVHTGRIGSKSLDSDITYWKLIILPRSKNLKANLYLVLTLIIIIPKHGVLVPDPDSEVQHLELLEVDGDVVSDLLDNHPTDGRPAVFLVWVYGLDGHTAK